MSFTFAGQYGPVDLRSQNPLTEALIAPASVAVYAVGTSTPVSLYTDRTAGTGLANPLPTGQATNAPGVDALGNVIFFAAPGRYDMAVGSQTYTVTVYPDPADLAASLGLVVAYYDPIGGVYPTRATVTPNAAQPVLWVGPNTTLVTIGSGYATNGLDLQAGY
jgi:hypothetical protein